MNCYSVFDLSTGALTGQTIAAVDQESAQRFLARGHGVISGRHDHLCRRVNLESGMVEPWRPEPPEDTDVATWCWQEATERWVAEPTLAAFKAQAWSRIKACREAAHGAAVEAGGRGFDASPASRTALSQKALAAHVAWTSGSGGEWSVEWTTATNETVTLGAREVINLALALDQRDQAEHALSQALRGAIAAAASKSELDAICWPASTC